MIKEWSLADGICKRTIPCQSKPLDLAYSSDGQFIVSAHYDGSLHVFDASTGSNLQHVERVHRRASGPGMSVIATALPFNMVTAGRDSAVCITDVYHGEVRPAPCLKHHSHPTITAGSWLISIKAVLDCSSGLMRSWLQASSSSVVSWCSSLLGASIVLES